MTGITISLVSFNQCHDLKRLLPSLVPAANLAQAGIMLVDNRSTDGTQAYVNHTFPDIQITYNPDITGYGGNHNINLNKTRTQYFVIMNTDMTVNIDVFVHLREFMDNNHAIGMLSPKILNEDGTIQGLNKRYPTVLDLFLRRFVPRSLQGLFKKRLDYYEMRDVGYDIMYDVEFISGAFMFCRTDLLKSIGGFDPRYFLYFEDVDLCRRIQRTHRTVYFPDVSVTHYWERSAHKNWTYTVHFIKGAQTYFNQWGYRFL